MLVMRAKVLAFFLLGATLLFFGCAHKSTDVMELQSQLEDKMGEVKSLESMVKEKDMARFKAVYEGCFDICHTVAGTEHFVSRFRCDRCSGAIPPCFSKFHTGPLWVHSYQHSAEVTGQDRGNEEAHTWQSTPSH